MPPLALLLLLAVEDAVAELLAEPEVLAKAVEEAWEEPADRGRGYTDSCQSPLLPVARLIYMVG